MEAKPKYEDVKKSLRELKSLLDDAKINEFEYRGKYRQLLDQLEPSLPLGYSSYASVVWDTWRSRSRRAAAAFLA